MNRNFAHQIDNAAEVLRDSCDRHASWFIIGFSIVYLLVTCWIASQKMLWNDELFTLYIAKLASFSDIMAAVSTGADQQPPSFYFLTHSVLRMLGTTELAVRLPEVLAFWLMSLCLFRFVSKRLSALYGFAAMVFPLVTIAYEYSYEARPYGLVLGFSSLALVCWQEATERRRTWWLVGLAVSGAAAVSSHYYAVFLLIPLGIGEIVRSLTQRRIDFPVWVALGCMMLPLLLFLPFLQQARTYSHHFWAQPKWGMIPGFYYFLLMPTIGPIIATLIASSLWPAGESSHRPPSPHASQQPPCYEIAAALGFIAIPAIAVIVAKLVTGAFTHRYALSAVIGFSILCAIAVHRLHGGRAIMGVCFTLFICVWFMVTAVIQLKQDAATTASWSKAYEFLQSEEEDATLPIVVADLHTFMTLTYYGPPAVSSRIVYLADPQASIKYLGHDTVDRGILDLRPWFPVTVEEYAPYIASHGRFLIYAQGVRWGDLNWLLYKLRSASVRIELKSRSGDFLLFLVTADSHERSTSSGVDRASAKQRVRLMHATTKIAQDPYQ